MKRRILFALTLGLGALQPLAGCSGGDSATPPGTSGDGGAGGDSTSATGGAEPVPNRYFLRIDDAVPADVVLDLDKQKALSVFGSEADTVHLLDVDPTPMLINVLTLIQNACGTAWKNDATNPQHNCALTALGQSFGANWQTTPEFALVRLLSMTPANTDASGTSLDDLQQLFVQNPGLFAVDFAQLLAEAMAIGRTTPFIPLQNLAASARTGLIATHPFATPAGDISVTLFDGLLDMAPLASKLGPVGQAPYANPGEHPGLLVPDDASFQTASDALLPEFHMRATARSNLVWVDGVDLSGGRGEAYVMNGTAPLSFDFMDPEKTLIEGIADNPTLTMRFALNELSTFVPSCTDPATCEGNKPQSPVGANTVWTVAPFFAEHLVADSALATYGTRVFSKCYLTLNPNCLMGVDIGTSPHPPGWTVFTSSVQGVSVPPPQYLWELLTEVGQVALHDPTGDGVPDIAEGQARATFALHDVPIGLTGDEILASIRPNLQSQSDLIANIVAGKFWKENGALDFSYRRADDGNTYLYFAAPSDLRPDAAGSDLPKAYSYAHRGFFSDATLEDSSKVSSTAIAGVSDTEHEKVALAQGDNVLYVEDDAGERYRLKIFVPQQNALEIVLEVEPVEAP